MIKLQLSYC